MLTATACGNGNLLLSWGPKWDGAFDPVQVKRLEEVGEWSELYGHTIYNTEGGPWYPEKWGGSTYRGNKVFVHITEEMQTGLKLTPVQNKILSAEIITGGIVSFSQTEKAVKLDFEKPKKGTESIIIELTFENEIAQ